MRGRVLLFCLLVVFLQAQKGFAEDGMESPQGYGKSEGLLGSVVVGPKVTLLGVPVPFRVGLESKWANTFGVSIDYGFLPALSFSNVSLKMNGTNFAVKYYPWQRAFFVGVAFGKQSITGSQTENILGQSTTVTLNLDTTYIAPHLGWRWTGKSGFFFGMELGAQIPMSTTTSVTNDNPAAGVLADPEYLTTEAEIRDQAQKFGNNVFPYFGFLQFGWFI